jgi:hypothetical protein
MESGIGAIQRGYSCVRNGRDRFAYALARRTRIVLMHLAGGPDATQEYGAEDGDRFPRYEYLIASHHAQLTSAHCSSRRFE